MHDQTRTTTTATTATTAVIDTSDLECIATHSPPARSRLFSVLLISTAALLIALAWPMFSGRVYTANDLGDFHLPLRNFYSQQLAAGQPFDWCPDLYCGFYLTGEGQVGAYHPLHWMLYRTLPLWLAFDLECWLSYPLMLIGVYLFLRRWQLDREPAWFSALVFTFGGFSLLHFVHPNAVAIVAHLPWILWAIDYLIRPKRSASRRWAFAAIALLTASQILLGYPQFVFYSFAVEVGYVFLLALIRNKTFTSLAANLSVWAAAVLLGVLIGAVQLLPTVDALQHSVRQSPTANAANLSIGTSLHPLNLVQLITPYLFTKRVVGQNTLELSLYIGMVPLVLAVWWLCLGQRQQPRFRPLTIAALGAALCSLLWSFGEWGPLGWLQANIPGINNFRLPCRAIFVFQLSLSVLASLGFMALVRQEADSDETQSIANRTNIKSFGLWWLLLPSILLTLAAPFLWPDYMAKWPLVAFGPAMLVAAIWLVRRAADGSRWALSTLVLLSAIDLGIYGMTSSILDGAQTLADYVRTTDVPPGFPTKRVGLDLLTGTEAAPGQKQLRTGDRILLTGWKRVDGYAGLEPARQLDYRQPAALRVAGVSWLSADAATQIDRAGNHGWMAKLDRKSVVPQQPTLSFSKNMMWLRLGNLQPRAWLVRETITSANPAADIASISIANEALVDPDFKEAVPPSDLSGTVETITDQPGSLTFKVDCPMAQLLVIGESYHAGWQATLDGNGATNPTVLRVDGDFLGTIVPAGKHEISLKFRPESLRLGRLVTCFGLGLMVVMLLLTARPWRRRPN